MQEIKTIVTTKLIKPLATVFSSVSKSLLGALVFIFVGTMILQLRSFVIEITPASYYYNFSTPIDVDPNAYTRCVEENNNFVLGKTVRKSKISDRIVVSSNIVRVNPDGSETSIPGTGFDRSVNVKKTSEAGHVVRVELPLDCANVRLVPGEYKFSGTSTFVIQGVAKHFSWETEVFEIID